MTITDQIYPNDWKENILQYPWAENCAEQINISNISLYPYDQLPWLARWMVSKGYNVDISNGFSNIQPGDIIFFATWDGFTKNVDQSKINHLNYSQIKDAAICTKVVSRPQQERSSVNAPRWEYQITVIKLENSADKKIVEYILPDSDTDTYIADQYIPPREITTKGPALDTIWGVCRPNLTSSGLTYLELEAAKLGLHTVPENDAQLEIVKRARICSDIEWTPGIDYDRPMPLTGEFNQFHWHRHWQSPYPVMQSFSLGPMIEGKFKAGTTYKGMPWTSKKVDDWDIYYAGDQSLICPEQFLSLIENENAPTYIETNSYVQVENNKTYPIYGWYEPFDLIRYVFGPKSAALYPDWGDGDYSYYNSLLFDKESSTGGDMFDFTLDYNTLQLGDIIYRNFTDYCAIVTDLIRDDLGNVTHIETVEATRYGLVNPNDLYGQNGNLIRRKLFTINEFSKWFCLDDWGDHN